MARYKELKLRTQEKNSLDFLETLESPADIFRDIFCGTTLARISTASGETIRHIAQEEAGERAAYPCGAHIMQP